MAAQTLARSSASALLQQYLQRLQTDPLILGAAAEADRQRTLRWAADELRDTVPTLEGLPLDEAEYELAAVLREARERLGVETDGPAPLSSAA